MSPGLGDQAHPMRVQVVGLDYFGAKYLSATQGRWTTADEPLTYADWANPQSWNLYSYADNSPTSFADADGHIGYCATGTDSTGKNCNPPPRPDPSLRFLVDSMVGNLRAMQQNAGPESGGVGLPRRCTAGLTGAGFGWVIGTSGGAGLGPNGGFGLGGTGSIGGGTFIGAGQATQGTFKSGGASLTDKGSLGNYPPNRTGPRSATYGAFAGIGGGLFVTNAGNSSTLSGPFTSVIVSYGLFGIEVDYSSGIWVASVTAGKSSGLGAAVLQTNTFSTVCR